MLLAASALLFCIGMILVCQVVFTDVLIVGRLDVDGQSFAPIGLHKIDAACL